MVLTLIKFQFWIFPIQNEFSLKLNFFILVKMFASLPELQQNISAVAGSRKEIFIGGCSFNTYAKFSEKLIFVTPWFAHGRVRNNSFLENFAHVVNEWSFGRVERLLMWRKHIFVEFPRISLQFLKLIQIFSKGLPPTDLLCPSARS